MAKTETPIKSATKTGMNALMNTAGAAVGIPPGMTKPLIGAIIALLILVIGSITIIGYAIAHYFSFLRYFIRDKQNGGPANTLTVQATNATIYVNLIYPSGSDCTTKYGGELLFKKNSTETACSSATDAIKNDGDTKIGVKLSGTFYEGAAAASDPAVSTANARFVASPSTASGTTHWLYIPGYHNGLSGDPSTGIPVVGTMANTPTATKGPDGEDLGLRFDLYAKSAADANNIRSNWISHDNCKKSQPGYYDCAITGVTIKFGQINSGTVGPSGGTGSCTPAALRANRSNQTTISVQIWAYDASAADHRRSTTRSVTVHANCAESVRQIFSTIYADSSSNPIDLNDPLGFGCYRSDRETSRHSWGAACDINPTYNYYVQCRSSGGSLGSPTGMVGSYWRPGSNGINEGYCGYSSGGDVRSIPIGGTIDRAFASQRWGRGVKWHSLQGGGTGERNDFMHYSVDGK